MGDTKPGGQQGPRQEEEPLSTRMDALLSEGRGLSKKVSAVFEKNITIGERDLRFRFQHHPLRNL
ncbi:MAG: hypothetical protein H7836_09130 [Magnetococcus sp. YQC-3]